MSVHDLQDAITSISSETKTAELVNACNTLQENLASNSIDIQNVVKTLSEFILKEDDAKLFKKYLSNILLALVSAKIPLKPVFSNENFDTCNDNEKISHLEYSVILAALSDHPDILQYALKYFDINKAPPFEVFIHHEESYNVAPKKRRLLDCRPKITDKQIVTCSYTLLTKLPNELSAKWDWSKFVANFTTHQNGQIKWMVKECMVLLTNMCDAQAETLTNLLNIQDKDSIKNITQNKYEPVIPMNKVLKDDISPENVINIDGILLPIHEKNNVQKGKLVPVKSTVNNLRSLALTVASGTALCLMGPVGSGKTSLVEHLAAITGRKGIAFKKVQLGDQTDSRMLLGAHQCTDVPGEFVWKPGVLTEAVQNGHWLLLEDIDSAALDVASTLSSLLERNALCVPGYRDALPVTPGFQLFVTQRTLTTNYGFQKKMSNSSTLLQKHLTQINVEPLSRSELGEIIQVLYPELSTICSRIIEVFMLFSVGSHDTSLQSTEVVDSAKDNNLILMRGSRLISTRDLFKWCSRAVIGFDVSSPESALKVLQDALDIFTCSVSSPEHRLELAKKVGLLLGIVETKSEFYCKHYKPNVSLTPSFLEVGRSKIPRVGKSLETTDFGNKQAVFSFTRQSACLLERIACCVTSNEPVLLVGETGTGKTSSVQYLANQTGHKLVVINMNQQSDSADLLGGYKPVDLKYVIRPIRNQFEDLFRSFYNTDKNQKFLGHIETCYETENWTALIALMKQSHKAAVDRLTAQKKKDKLEKWRAFGHKLQKLEQQIKAASKLTFAFIEGSLVKAMQEGHWVLLDEINLASADILECLAGLLEDKNETIDLLEKGDKVPIKRHPEFTLFACMNPATDVGKKDLPAGLRNRFTEFFIDELTERNDLMLLIGDYLYHMNLSGAILEAIYTFYANIKKEAKLNLVDGSGNTPHYSLRTLCRALTAAAKAKCGTVSRSLYEAFCLSFLTQLDSSSHPKVEAMIAKAVIGKKNIKSVINQMIPEPQGLGQNYLLFEGHWIPQGKLEIAIPEGYILTPTVRKNLRDIARIISLGRLPVLLQGDTSVGKTSLITYIAKASGNYCVRINNHEHTDLQEYIGSYATDSSGKLVFKEGVLVEAMRKGYWVILDELNLAPSDVLEALNRVLDDNRELFIPETQQVIKADPNFMLFATQNPPGLYGGRKMLSRAFRNRFVELHFDEIPKNELQTILHQRCHIPPNYSKKMIAVMADLQIRRRGSAAVQGKDGFITLRDLFRWGQRYKQASKDALTNDKFYDWDQHIADEGYLILAGKVRQTDERSIIEEVIEKHIKRKVDPENLFSLHAATSPVTKSILETILNNRLPDFGHVVWTFNMRRLAVLIAKSFSFDEPVLLVGETGCGKTTICQVLAALSNRQLLSVNCHMHTESSDFLGGLRPVRQYKNDGRLFEWVDGPLIKAMEAGDLFLADEISLADDSVLERMNSLLEPERQLVLAERGMEENSDIVVITANPNFHFIGTMNPGGDFGKKELSPALRNRFTEIWCDSVTSRNDLLKVLEQSVQKGISLIPQEDGTSGIGSLILDFTDWLKNSEVSSKFPFSIRDLLSWVHFINVTVSKGVLAPPQAYVHGACMTFLDCFGTTLTGHIELETLVLLRNNAIDFLLNQIKTVGSDYLDSLKDLLTNKQTKFVAVHDADKFGIKPFYVEVGQHINSIPEEETFKYSAPTTGANTLRLLRGLQLNKAILLEGNPGVGKTSLVVALAQSSGHNVVRINLSDQTDITDLFGTDLPTEDGSFTFKEGAFLTALQNGDWILLDELNLAPQPVLEGLNACLDHRGEIFIPELGKTFKVKQQTRIFASQNPLKQGGARRGLPISFLNRFTQVYVDTLTKEDMLHIVEAGYSEITPEILNKMVTFNCQVAHEINDLQTWGHVGAPFEMNLRDITRWCDALLKDWCEGRQIQPGKYVDILYVNRMRTIQDKEKMIEAYDKIFLPGLPRSASVPTLDLTDKTIFIGDVVLSRNQDKIFTNRRAFQTNLVVLRDQLPALKALAQCVKMNWLSILVGPTATGKSSIVQVLADLSGNELHVVPVTSAMDVSDLLGGFEQVDYNRTLESLFDKVENLTIQAVRNIWVKEEGADWHLSPLLAQLHEFKSIAATQNGAIMKGDLEFLKTRITLLQNHCEVLLQQDIPNVKEFPKKVQDVIISLRKLQNKVALVTSLNAGGKFEFVDSLLVKAMIEGSWLLLDNVNLTSAAVLDRLNGLLETNGVLSIPERGDSGMIRPHPNFRVFFTMDPKYGEISRAMRNRGVEIFFVSLNENNTSLSECMSHMDLTVLLASCGLPSQYHDLCFKCHEAMTSFIRGFERPTLSHLLQAAHLTWQQIVRGIDVATAFISSFSDVYIKPRCGSDFDSNVVMSLAEMKNVMLRELEQLVNNEQQIHAKNTLLDHTLTVKGLCSSANIEIAKQIAYVAVQEVNESKQTVFSLFTVYQKVSRPTLVLVKAFVEKNLENAASGAVRDVATLMNSKAFEYSRITDELHAFRCYYPETFPLEGTSVFKANVQSLTLYNILVRLYLQAIVKPNLFSVLDYSKAVLRGNLVDDFSDTPILRNCKVYLDLIDGYIIDAIRIAEDSLDDKTTCKIIEALNWRDRIVRLVNEPIFKDVNRNLLRDDIVALLTAHNKWFLKNLVKQFGSLPAAAAGYTAEFKQSISSFFRNNNQDNLEMIKLGKKVRQMYGGPALFFDQKEYDLCLAKSEIYKKITFDMGRPIRKQLNLLAIDYDAVTDMTMAFDVPDREKLAVVQENVIKLLENVNVDEVESRIKLLPIISYIIQRVLNLVKVCVLEMTTDLSNCIFKLTHNLIPLVSSLVHYGKKTNMLPPALLNQMEVFIYLQEDRPDMFEKLLSIPPKFWDEYYKAVLYAPAFYASAFLKDQVVDESDENMDRTLEIPINSEKLSKSAGLMSYYLQHFLISNDNPESKYVLAYEAVPINEKDNYSKQLGTILNLVWKNISTLHVGSVAVLETEAEYGLKKYERFILCLHAIYTPNTEEAFEGFSLEAIKTLKENFKDKHFAEIFMEAYYLYEDTRSVSPNMENELMRKVYAQLGFLTSFMFIKVMSEISTIDQVTKYRLKTKYIQEDLEMFDSLLGAYYLHGLVSGIVTDCRNIQKPSDVVVSELDPETIEELEKVHPYCKILMEMKAKTAANINKYGLVNTFRPEKPTYNEFLKDCRHFSKSVLSSKNTQELVTNLISITNYLHYNLKKGTSLQDVLSNGRVNDAIKQCASWLFSMKAFYKKVQVYSAAFPDLAIPLQSSLSDIMNSVTVLNDMIKELLTKIEVGFGYSAIVQHLILFPNSRLPPKTCGKEFLKSYLCEHFKSVTYIFPKEDNREIRERRSTIEHVNVLKMNLSELKMHFLERIYFETDINDNMHKTLALLVDVWEQQEKEIEKRKEADEALYVTRSKADDEDEEAMANEEIQEMFPSYTDQDFGEFRPPTLEQRPEKQRTDRDNNKPKNIITPEDISEIYKWHCEVIRTITLARWLPTPKKRASNDLAAPFMMRYPIFCRMYASGWSTIHSTMEDGHTASLMVLMSKVKAKIDGEETPSKVDFYRSAWVSETKQCLPILRQVKERTNALLDQWPDFPTLKEIIVITNRILGFPIVSPVSRFLTGLELLRDKIEEWNKNAHKGNNLIDVSLAVGQQIINWRKLEMSHWKECLNNVYQRKQAEAHKYWFHLFTVFREYISTSTNPPDIKRLIPVIKDFIEKSTLGEFEVRLELLYMFHCHIYIIPTCNARDELVAILWNIYSYYAQFQPQVAAYIKEKRAPIEKKLRDFVKICTWDRDLSYWSVKDTVEKAHKVLHKHTKEFEKVLKESASICFVDKTTEIAGDHVGIWDRPKRTTASNVPTGGAYMVDIANYLLQGRNFKKYLDEAEKVLLLPSSPVKYMLITKASNYIDKTRCLCRDTINNCGYAARVQALDDSVTTIIETAEHLRSLQVDLSLPKEKRESQAKSHAHQKRKAIADLYKYLFRIGLHYRTGLVLLNKDEDELYDFTIPPIEIEASISKFKSRRSDSTLVSLWSGCEKYYQKNIARYKTLMLALQQPHEDLGPPYIERCKGFSAQLMDMTTAQRKQISEYLKQICELRALSGNLMSLLDIENSDVKLHRLEDKLKMFADCYTNLIIILGQFSILLKSCPEMGPPTDNEPHFDPIISDTKMNNCFKNSDDWKDLYKRIKLLIDTAKKQRDALNKVGIFHQNENARPPFGTVLLPITISHIEVKNECKTNLANMDKDIQEILDEYKLKFRVAPINGMIQHPILKSLLDVSLYVKDVIRDVEEIENNYRGRANVDGPQITREFASETEQLLGVTMLMIQNIYKRYLPENQPDPEIMKTIDGILSVIPIGSTDNTAIRELVEDRHLRYHLDIKLSNDIKCLHMGPLKTKLQELLKKYLDTVNSGIESIVKTTLMRVIPIVEQALLFIQYFVTQKVATHRVSCKLLSVLLKIFTDIVSKGFCKHTETDEGEGEGGPGKMSGGMGLGDGEGQKDVSDRIENQDQLDDAQRPGEEKNQEDRDCKEEEQGVNMTDDFDSHLQDVEQREGDQDEQDNDEDDADKQMGDTDKLAENIDQQIWGSEEDEQDEESNQKKDEEKGKGESTGEKEMGAKDKEEQGTDDGAEGKDKKEKKDINEMKEPEVDDDHVDPYHGNQQPMPEPEDFELPDNMDVDGEENGEDKEGETESENPFDIDVMKENITEEEKEGEDKGEEEGKDNRAGLEVSSDEEGEGDDKEGDAMEEGEEKDKENDAEKPENETEDGGQDEDKDGGEIEDQAEAEQPEHSENPENPEIPEKDNEELPQNPENINEDDEVEQKKQEANPQANPSNNDPTAEDKAQNAEMDRGTDDNVDTNADQEKDEEAAATEQSQEQVGEEKQSMGRAELDKSETGHRGEKQAANRAERSQDKRNKRENKPADTDQERTLGDVNEKKRKQAQMLNVEKEDKGEEGGDHDDDAEMEADAYQHVKQAKKDDLQAIDAATKEQAEQQPVINFDEEEDAEELKEDEQVPMEVDDDEIEVQKAEELKPEKMKEGVDKDKEKSGNKKENGEEATGEAGVEVEGDNVVTATVPRGAETSYHTRLGDSQMETEEEMVLSTYMSIREWLSAPIHRPAVTAGVWTALWRDSAGAARALCERLRLVLEPTGRSRRAGDFRTGRAINMRRVIPYIASHFRKDRIWLRRTKPAKREYKIAIAVDDSSSMSDNRSKELAFESLALVSQALNLLESGELAVLSFGEKPNLLHPFSEQFTEHSGAKILEQLRFEQTKTKIAQLLDFSTVMFEEQAIKSDAVNAKLLVIVSDGRGIFSEGETRVLQAVRRARQQGIFLVYVIIDNPDNKDSIMDIRRPLLDPVTNTLTGFVSYLDTFPFPFYLILRDMSALPNVLGDALRQWFELAANTN